jgi:hypothetical protein
MATNPLKRDRYCGWKQRNEAEKVSSGRRARLCADDDVIYFQYDSSTPLRFSAPAFSVGDYK